MSSGAASGRARGDNHSRPVWRLPGCRCIDPKALPSSSFRSQQQKFAAGLDHRDALRGDDVGGRQIRAGAYQVDGGLAGAAGLILISQLCVDCRCRIIFEGDGLGRCGAFWPNLRIRLVTLFAAHGFIIPGLSDVAKATMFKLHFGISAAQSAKLVVY